MKLYMLTYYRLYQHKADAKMTDCISIYHEYGMLGMRRISYSLHPYKGIIIGEDVFVSNMGYEIRLK